MSLALYRFAAEHAAASGILLADTKFELGLDEEGRLVLADEAFTPDSSRFWPADEYRPGGPQPSFDKQFARDYAGVARLGQDAARAGAAGRGRGRDAGPLRRGVRTVDPASRSTITSPIRRWCSVDHRAIIRPKEGILDPEGQAVTSSLRRLGYEVRDARVGRVVQVEVDAADERSARRDVEQMCEQLLANPLIEVFEVERVA